MTYRMSTGARTKRCAANGSSGAGFATLFASAFIDLYTGTQPASADNAPGATLLRTYSVAGSGFTWGTASGGSVSRASGEILSGVAVASGVAGWARMRLAGDLGTTNTTDVRLDFSVAASGADASIKNTSVTTGETDYWGTITWIEPEHS